MSKTQWVYACHVVPPHTATGKPALSGPYDLTPTDDLITTMQEYGDMGYEAWHMETRADGFRAVYFKMKMEA